MKLNQIGLKNFKCFEETVIELGKITLLTGANSSGKSSIIYSLLAALQSSDFPFEYSINGNLIRMGDYNEVVFGHDSDRDFNISFEVVNEKSEVTKIKTSWEKDEKLNLPKLKDLLIEKPHYRLEIQRVRKYHLKFEFFEDKTDKEIEFTPDAFKKVLGGIRNILSTFSDTQELKLTSSSKDEKVSFEDFINKFSKIKQSINFTFSDFKDLEFKSYKFGNFIFINAIKSAQNLFESFEKKTNYISSFRLFPERTYYENSKRDLKIGRFGENYIDQIIYWEANGDKKFDELLEELRKIEILQLIKSNKLAGGRFELLVQTKKKGIISALNDVGFGVSQFLPIITADIQLGKSSTLVVAQPEIHLHPTVQASFSNYIVDSVLNKNKNYVIETHSEYLLNRLRLLIAQDKIKEDDVKVYHLVNNGEKTNVHNLKFAKNGQIVGAPKDFFDTYMMDVMNISINAI